MAKGDGKISYEHDSRGRVYKTIEYGEKGDCLVSIHEFDLANRIIEERREDIEGNVLTKVTYGYDIAGNRNEVITYVGENALTTTITYNSRKLPTKIVDPNQVITHIEYKYDFYNAYGQAVPFTKTTDSMGNITEEIKDTHGRVAIVTQKNSYGDLLHKTEYFYDLNGNKIRQIDSITNRPNKIAKKIVSETAYDCMNRVETTTEAVGSVDQKRIEYRYNAYGELEEIIKADAVRLKYEYDPLGRMKKYFSSDNTFEYIYTYDSKGNLEKIEDIVNKQDTLRTYDKFNRLDKETLGNNLTVQYTYDCANRHRTITFPDKSGVELNYKAHRLMKVHRLSPNKKRLYTHSYLDYDLEDKLLRSKLIEKSGVAEFNYDNLGRPTKLLYNKWNEIISSYDDVGNILKREINDSRGEVTCKYRYDDLYQVIKEKGVAKHSYAFDSLHNRIKKDKAKMQLNDLNQILHDSKVEYTYDLNGNLTEMKNIDGTIVFNYDALDRLIEVLSKNQRIYYTYDALNRRLSKRCDTKVSKNKWSTGKKTNYLYVGDNEIGSYDDKGVVQELRLLGLSKSAEIGGAIAVELQDQVYAPLHDHLGNVTALVDAKTAKVVEVYRYSAFGEEQILDSEGNSLETSINPWRFSSKRIDTETGFVYFGRRYYNPELGRWISPDPIGKSGGPNPYAYVMNKPLTCYDAYGLYGQNDESSGWGWSSCI